MRYYNLPVGEKTLRVRVRMRDHEELDQLCGGSFMEAFAQTGDMWRVLKAMLAAGCHAADDYKPAQVDDIIDELIDEGKSAEDAGAIILEIGTVSGFFTEQTLRNYRAQREKAEQTETASL